jgi:hypothetical protein
VYKSVSYCRSFQGNGYCRWCFRLVLCSQARVHFLFVISVDGVFYIRLRNVTIVAGVDGYKNPPSPDLTHATGCKHPRLMLFVSVVWVFTLHSYLSNKNGNIRYSKTRVYVLRVSASLLQHSTVALGVPKLFYLYFPFFSATKLIIWVNHSVTIAWSEGELSVSFTCTFYLSLFISQSSPVTLCYKSFMCPPIPRWPDTASGPYSSCLFQSWTVSELKASETHETQFPFHAPLWNYNVTYVCVQ